ncbi:hypothetical protein IC582_027548 [Cucumis melo]
MKCKAETWSTKEVIERAASRCPSIPKDSRRAWEAVYEISLHA